jgi:hypothetical protein
MAFAQYRLMALCTADPAFHPQWPRQDWSDRYPLVVAALEALRLP